jgi:hypothetical protein
MLSEVQRQRQRTWREELKVKAARAVIQYWFPFCYPPDVKPFCFDCGSVQPRNLSELQFDHLVYASTSAGVGKPSSARHHEAIQHPERFHVVCSAHHDDRELKRMGKNGFRADVNSFQQLKLLPWRERKLKKEEEERLRREEEDKPKIISVVAKPFNPFLERAWEARRRGNRFLDPDWDWRGETDNGD